MAERRDGGGAYWVFVILLCIAGVLGIFSIGAPLLLLGVVLAVVSPWRSQPRVLWPAVAAVCAFVVAYVVVAPLGCTSTASSTSGAIGRTVCTNVVGIDDSGAGAYQPSLWSALVAASVAAVVAGAGVWVRPARSRRRRGRGPAADRS